MRIINKSVLTLQYLPDILLHRENEVKLISSYIERFDNGEAIPNIIIYGPTGSGKTSVIKYAIKNYQPKNLDIEYLNGRFYNTTYRVLSKLTYEEDRLGLPMSYFIDKLRTRSKNMLVAIDEVDFIKDIDELLYLLSRLNDESKVYTSMILITNSIQLKSRLDIRTLSSLNEREIFFNPYSANQLVDILEHRVKMAIEGEYEKAAISKIGAIAAAESGDARYALKILIRALEIAENENAERFKEVHVDKALESIEFDIVAETLKSLPINMQIVMYTIAKMYLTLPKDLFDSTINDLISISDVFNNYVKISENVFKRKAKSLKWFKHYLSELENLGLLSMVVMKNKNREVVSYIRLGVNHKDILRYFDKYYGLR